MERQLCRGIDGYHTLAVGMRLTPSERRSDSQKPTIQISGFSAKKLGTSNERDPIGVPNGGNFSRDLPIFGERRALMPFVRRSYIPSSPNTVLMAK